MMRIKSILILVLVGLLVVGCSFKISGLFEISADFDTATPEPTQTPEITPTHTLIPTIAPSATGTPTAPPTGTPKPSPTPASENLLVNPNFDGECSMYGNIPEFQLLPGWHPWFIDKQEGDKAWENCRPEYKCANAYFTDQDPDGAFEYRVRSLLQGQQYFSFYCTHIAGLYQRVSGFTPGDVVRFSDYQQHWSTPYDNPFHSEAAGKVDAGVCIDPLGGTDPFAPSVTCFVTQLLEWGSDGACDGQVTPEDYPLDCNPVYDDTETPFWNYFEVTAIAENETITVFTYSSPEYAVKHNDVFNDDARLEKIGHGPIPTPYPTPTPEAAQWVTPSVYLNLRDTPDGEVLRVLAPGELCQLLDINGDWYKIKCGNTTGWAWGGYLDPAGISKKPSCMHGVYLR